MVAYPRNGTNYVICDHNSLQSMSENDENVPPGTFVGNASEEGGENSVEKQKLGAYEKQQVASVESRDSSNDTDDEHVVLKRRRRATQVGDEGKKKRAPTTTSSSSSQKADPLLALLVGFDSDEEGEEDRSGKGKEKKRKRNVRTTEEEEEEDDDEDRSGKGKAKTRKRKVRKTEEEEEEDDEDDDDLFGKPRRKAAKAKPAVKGNPAAKAKPAVKGKRVVKGDGSDEDPKDPIKALNNSIGTAGRDQLEAVLGGADETTTFLGNLEGKMTKRGQILEDLGAIDATIQSMCVDHKLDATTSLKNKVSTRGTSFCRYESLLFLLSPIYDSNPSQEITKMIVNTDRNMCPLDKKLYEEFLEPGTTFNKALLLKVTRDLLNNPNFEFDGVLTDAQLTEVAETSRPMRNFLNSVLQQPDLPENDEDEKKKKQYSNLRQDITRYVVVHE